jgi:hypothetical protein
MKKLILFILFVLIFSAKLIFAETFFGTSICISGTSTSINNQGALLVNASWELNINKFFEIGIIYSKLITNVNADFIDQTSKTQPLIFLNYGGLDLGFYLFYNNNFTIRTGVTLAGGGYKYMPKDNIKFDNYSDINIGVYEPQFEIGYFFSESWLIAFKLTYRYIDIDNTNFSSFGAGLGVKYGIFN